MRPDIKILFLEKWTVNKMLQEYPNRPLYVAADLPCYKLNKLPKGYKTDNQGIFIKLIKPEVP